MYTYNTGLFYKLKRNINDLFESMFDLRVTYGEIKLGDEFKPKVLKWLDNNPDYLNQAYKQVNYFLSLNP